MPPQMDETTRVIEDFLKGFKREQEYYRNQANKAKAICEEELRRSGIQAQVTARVKDRHSLREKLDQRSTVRGGYESVQAIREDIVDLAGVRISLYFPNHMSLTENIIGARFQIRQSVDHSKSKHVHGNSGGMDYLAQFPGYRGKHFQVSLKADNNNERGEGEDNERAEDKEWQGAVDEDAQEDKDIIEIQVVSMLHHAWTEVEHDLVYKQMSGSVSTEERRILDGLSGLTQLGELLLEQLHEAYLKRSKSENKEFSNFYELGSFLAAQQVPSDIDNGPLEFLYDFLKTVGYHKPSRLDSVISRLRESGWQKGELSESLGQAKPSLSVLLIDGIFTDLYGIQRKRKRDSSPEKPLSTMEKFEATVQTFIVLDTLFPPFQPWADKLFMNVKCGNFRREFAEWLDVVQEMDDLMRGNHDLTNEEEIALEEYMPWDFLHNHLDYVISFAFRLAKIGVCNDITRFTHLREMLRVALQAAIPDEPHSAPYAQKVHSDEDFLQPIFGGDRMADFITQAFLGEVHSTPYTETSIPAELPSIPYGQSCTYGGLGQITHWETLPPFSDIRRDP